MRAASREACIFVITRQWRNNIQLRSSSSPCVCTVQCSCLRGVFCVDNGTGINTLFHPQLYFVRPFMLSFELNVNYFLPFINN